VAAKWGSRFGLAFHRCTVGSLGDLSATSSAWRRRCRAWAPETERTQTCTRSVRPRTGANFRIAKPAPATDDLREPRRPTFPEERPRVAVDKRIRRRLHRRYHTRSKANVTAGTPVGVHVCSRRRASVTSSWRRCAFVVARKRRVRCCARVIRAVVVAVSGRMCCHERPRRLRLSRTIVTREKRAPGSPLGSSRQSSRM
jgi:hypothetical protein